MNYTEYLCRIDDAKTHETADAYLMEYGYPFDCPYDAQTLIIWAQIIFTASRNDWKALTEIAIEKIKLFKSAAGFAKYFEIPYKSLRNWIEGRRQPPIYIIQLVGYALISELPEEEREEDDV